ncbi:MAG: hypothetical protein JSS30_03820 [Verrucomicrobia bacterium]|nr:hypothetical protein [Verrucomicrobiota bacterium]
MKINPKILCIPPYISTSWKNVLSLHMDRREGHPILVIGLLNGSTIEIPRLESIELEAIFNAHQKHLEQEAAQTQPPKPSSQPTVLPGMNIEAGGLISFPLPFSIEGNNMGNLLQHNQDAADSPDLPKEVLEKIAGLTKAIGFDNPDNFPKAEPHCNCMHCQIMRVFHQEPESHEEQQEEVVTDQDLQFRDWDIRQAGDKLYVVSNPLCAGEHYNVFLGSPVGCTCGEHNCEHIRAVLNS